MDYKMKVPKGQRLAPRGSPPMALDQLVPLGVFGFRPHSDELTTIAPCRH